MVSIQGDDIVIAEMAEYNTRIVRALVRSMNRSIKSGETVMVRAIAGDVGLASRDVRAALRSTPATFDRPVARLAASLKRIALEKFNARGPMPSRGRGQGVSWRIGGSTRRDRGLFRATMRSGHVGVFARVGGKGASEGAWSDNLPIAERFGPSIGQVFAKHRPAGQARALETFQANFDREMAYRSRTGGATVEVVESGGDA